MKIIKIFKKQSFNDNAYFSSDNKHIILFQKGQFKVYEIDQLNDEFITIPYNC